LEKIITKKTKQNNKKTMWENPVTIHSVLKKKITKLNSNQFNIKKIKSTKIILEKIMTKKENKKKKKNHVGKHCSNPQCFVRKATPLSTHVLAIL
jgi:hypothetical protein